MTACQFTERREFASRCSHHAAQLQKPRRGAGVLMRLVAGACFFPYLRGELK